MISPIEVLCWILCFLGFCIVQALVINGVHYCFQGGCISEMNKGRICKGGVFYMMDPEFFERHKGKWWTMPLWACIRCQSSFWGTVTFWPIILWIFGFQVWEIFIWVMDMFSVLSISYIVYKKL